MLKTPLSARLWISSIFLALVAVAQSAKEKHESSSKDSSKQRTLYDYKDLDPLDNGDSMDRGSLRTLVRVKRDKRCNGALSACERKPNYLEDLADSFPRATVLVKAREDRETPKDAAQFLENLKYKVLSGNKNVDGYDEPFPTRSIGLEKPTLKELHTALNNVAVMSSGNIETLIRSKRSEAEVEKVREPLEKEALPSPRILEPRPLRDVNARQKNHRRKGKRKKKKGKHVKGKEAKRMNDSRRPSKGQRSLATRQRRLQRRRDAISSGKKLIDRFDSIDSSVNRNANFAKANAKRGAARSKKSTVLHNAGLSQESKFRIKRNDNSKETRTSEDDNYDELKYFQSIREPDPGSAECSKDAAKLNSQDDTSRDSPAIRSAREAKEFAARLMDKVNELSNYLTNQSNEKRRERKIEPRAIDDFCSNITAVCAALERTPELIGRCGPAGISRLLLSPELTKPNFGMHGSDKKRRTPKRKRLTERQPKRKNNIHGEPLSGNGAKREAERRMEAKWSNWTDWSGCTVTCGKGRQIRWRYCTENCSAAETEMEEKACQLPACPPGKFLGIF